MSTPTPSIAAIVEALRCGQPDCACAQNGTSEALVHCPAHDEATPALFVTEWHGCVLVHCRARCSQVEVVHALRTRGLWAQPEEAASPASNGRSVLQHRAVTLTALAAAGGLPADFLRELGLSDTRRHGATTVRIPYVDATGNLVAVRFWFSLGPNGPQFAWRRDDHPTLYGLDRLPDARRAGWVLLLHSELDCWTAWYRDLPHKDIWHDVWDEYLAGLDVYLWEAPDAPHLPLKLARSVPSHKIVHPLNSAKDLSSAPPYPGGNCSGY